MIRYLLIFFFFLIGIPQLYSQVGKSAYEFLKIPVSVHSATLGGNNVSIVEDDVTLAYTNPALLSNISTTVLNFNYTSYISDTDKLSATFAKLQGERGAWIVGAQALNYGSMKETSVDYKDVGDFSASDVALHGGYSYLFSERWSGGVIGKILLSNYGDYSSVALAVDMGINYYDADEGVSP